MLQVKLVVEWEISELWMGVETQELWTPSSTDGCSNVKRKKRSARQIARWTKLTAPMAMAARLGFQTSGGVEGELADPWGQLVR